MEVVAKRQGITKTYNGVPEAMRRYRKLGAGDVKAKFVFVCTRELSQKQLYTILYTLITAERQERLEQSHIQSFVAFVEGAVRRNAQMVTNVFDIDGEIAYLTRHDVVGKLEEKIFHEMESLRNPTFVSKQPPQFLTERKLVIAIGSPRYLMDSVHEYLEHQGLLRAFTIQLMKEVGSDLRPYDPLSKDFDYLRLDVAETAIRGKSGFYPGNIEELGKLVRVRATVDEDERLTTTQLLERISKR